MISAKRSGSCSSGAKSGMGYPGGREPVRSYRPKGNYTSSAEVEGTAGPVGRELSAGVATVNAPVYTYSFTKGLFGGVSLSGLGYASAVDTNENFYGQRLTPKDIS